MVAPVSGFLAERVAGVNSLESFASEPSLSTQWVLPCPSALSNRSGMYVQI